MFSYFVLILVALAVVLVEMWFMRVRMGWQLHVYASVTAILWGLGAAFYLLTPENGMPPIAVPANNSFFVGVFLMGLGAAALLFGFLEFVVLRLIGMFRLGAISRVTYYEGLLQPFTMILMGMGIAAIVISAWVPFVTLSEDSKMYRDIVASFALLFTLPVMILAATKVIDEEIENRTMLTLMSKPVARWQVIIGKYLGVLMLVFVMMGVLSVIAWACSYLRYFDDMRIDYVVENTLQGRQRISDGNIHAMLALAPMIVLQFFQVSILAAVSVAVSTRWGIAVNVTMVVLLYIGANLARFAGSWSYAMPGLGLLDISQRLIYGDYNMGEANWIKGLPSYGQIWQYVGLCSAYTLLYISSAISFGIALFRNRELT